MSAAPEPAVTRIAIGPHATVVSGPGADGAHQSTSLRIGAAHPGRPLRRHPPTELELEEGIAAVEDAVMPLARRLAPGTRLVTADAHARGLLPAGPAGPRVLTIEAVEAAFNVLAAVASGRPQSASRLPADPAFDGYLLVLREFMHHCGFDSLTVEPADGAPPRAAGSE